ncbi:MAG: SsrA-binding protein SmpB [Planctomycetes bacterium]|nr:SsrA-binding protein SmpB [Planctomycetota bacterium]
MKDYARNKKAYADYTISKSFEAGIVLTGNEVKSVRTGGIDLTGAFVIIRGEEAYIVNATIAPYQPQNIPEKYEKDRTLKLLMHKREITEIMGSLQQKGLTILPLRMYNKGAKIKVEIAIARGKRTYEKREKIKKRETQRDIERTMKNL